MLNVLQTQRQVRADVKWTWKYLDQLYDGHTSWNGNQERYEYFSMIIPYLEKAGKSKGITCDKKNC